MGTPRGGDLRDLMRQLIEEARRIPPPPPLPTNYDALLADVRAWLAALEGVKIDVQEALQEARERCEGNEGALAEANPADSEGWHRLMWLRCGAAWLGQQMACLGQRCSSRAGGCGGYEMCKAQPSQLSHAWAQLHVSFVAAASPAAAPPAAPPPPCCSQELPAMEARLLGVQDRAVPTRTAAKSLQGLVELIENEKVCGVCPQCGGCLEVAWTNGMRLLASSTFHFTAAHPAERLLPLLPLALFCCSPRLRRPRRCVTPPSPRWPGSSANRACRSW